MSVGVIIVMLLAIYRSLVTMLVSMVVIGLGLVAAQGVTATAGNLNIIGLTPYAVSMVTMLSLAAGTDYVIFLLGRYHEERSKGLDREEAFYVSYSGVSHVILGSGLTIVGALPVPHHDHAALLPDHGYALRDRGSGGHRRGTDIGAGGPDGGVEVRSPRRQAEDRVDAELAQGRYLHGSLAHSDHPA